ncbi:MAG: RidA family protein, partial [Pyrinomonadaceae bacterium]|nr:RidA family protein [Pyrinomonadaceae bacterium]
MARVEDRLSELGLSLPAPLTPPPGATFNFRLVKVHDGVAYVAGHGPFDGATPLVQGRLGDDLSLEDGYRAARLTALSMLASLKRELGDLDLITEWLRAVGYVHAAPGFSENAAVINGFSDLIVELWGEP